MVRAIILLLVTCCFAGFSRADLSDRIEKVLHLFDVACMRANLLRLLHHSLLLIYRACLKVIQPIIDKMAAKYQCAVSVALVKDDGQNGFKAKVAGGVIDVAPNVTDLTGTPTKTTDKFAWGSVTKVLTGSSILRLVTQGVIKLDDYAAQYIDPFMKAMKAKNPAQNFSSMADLFGPEVSFEHDETKQRGIIRTTSSVVTCAFAPMPASTQRSRPRCASWICWA